MPGSPQKLVLQVAADRVRITLPPPRLGVFRVVGAIVLVGKCAVAGAAVWGGFAADRLIAEWHAPMKGVFSTLCMMTLAAVLLVFRKEIWTGWCWLVGVETEVVITAEEIRWQELARPLRSKQSRRLDELREVTIGLAVWQLGMTPVARFATRVCDAVRLDFKEGPPMRIAAGHPSETLDHLAAELARFIALRSSAPPLPPVEVASLWGPLSDFATYERPTIDASARKGVIIHHHANGMSVEVPSLSHAIALTAVIVAVVFMNVLVVLQAMSTNYWRVSKLEYMQIVWALATINVFAFLPVCIAWRGRHTFEVTGPPGDPSQMLVVSVRRLLGTAQRAWRRDEIVSIRVATARWPRYHSNKEIRSVPQLHVQLRNGTKFRCLTQVRLDELRLLAWELRRALNLPLR